MAVAIRHILFVCTGNTGRSVAAEALAREWIADQGLATRGLDITVGSRGVAVDQANLQPEAHVVSLLAARGVDVSLHRATPLTAADAAAAAHILTMTVRHREIVHQRFPAAGGRIRLLSEAALGLVEDVSDAFGAPPAVYEAMLMRLDMLVRGVMDRLIG